MPDIWPYGPPHVYSRAQVYGWIASLSGPHPDPNVFTAIAEAESGFDAAVIYDNPPSEDYSVGIWQVNYFGNLYSGRVAQFGTPQQLIQGGITAQADAAVTIWREQGLGAWGSYTNGSYRKYLGGAPPPAEAVAPGQRTVPLNPPIGVGIDAWDGQVRDTATLVQQQSAISLAYARAIDSI